jgi:hypothetical protein
MFVIDAMLTLRPSKVVVFVRKRSLMCKASHWCRGETLDFSSAMFRFLLCRRRFKPPDRGLLLLHLAMLLEKLIQQHRVHCFVAPRDVPTIICLRSFFMLLLQSATAGNLLAPNIRHLAFRPIFGRA